MARSRKPAAKPQWVRYDAEAFLGGTHLLPPMEELAYRRICDLIYATGDDLADDDNLPTATKTGDAWPEIRAALIRRKKIKIVRGRITNDRCRSEIASVSGLIEARKAAGKAGAESRWGERGKSQPKKGDTPKALPRSDGASHGKPNGKRMPYARASSSREEENPLSTTRLDTARPPPDGKPADDLIRVVDEGCFEFWQRSRAPHHADRPLAADWAARGMTPGALAEIVRPACERRATSGGDMPVSLKFFANAVARALDAGPPAPAAGPEVDQACRAYSAAVEAWSRGGKEGPAPKAEAFGIELVDGRFRLIARAAA